MFNPLRSDGSARSYDEIATELLQLPVAEQIAAIDQLVAHSEPRVRLFGLLGAKEFVEREVPRYALLLLQDPSWSIRHLACDCVIERRVTEAYATVCDLLQNDPEVEVRALCAVALRCIAPKDAVPYLRTLVDVVSGEDFEGRKVKDILRHSTVILARDAEKGTTN